MRIHEVRKDEQTQVCRVSCDQRSLLVFSCIFFIRMSFIRDFEHLGEPFRAISSQSESFERPPSQRVLERPLRAPSQDRVEAGGQFDNPARPSDQSEGVSITEWK